MGRPYEEYFGGFDLWLCSPPNLSPASLRFAFLLKYCPREALCVAPQPRSLTPLAIGWGCFVCADLKLVHSEGLKDAHLRLKQRNTFKRDIVSPCPQQTGP
jgi:hypothetical protein